MGAAAGGAGPARGGVLARLACVPSSCSLCSASVWERSRYAALQGYCRPAEEMLKVPSYSPPGESSKAESLRGLRTGTSTPACGDARRRRPRKTRGLALLAAALGVLALGAAVPALSACARAGGQACGQELAGWACRARRLPRAR
ncbi:unnamed protein product, partial [Prorocentrum cordatum]